ncbi:MAG: DsbA family protein [Alphaproteobacteria bacterium]
MTQYTRYLVATLLLGTLALTGCDRETSEGEATATAPVVEAPSEAPAAEAPATPAATPAPAASAEAANPDVIMGGEATFGDPNAPVTVIEYASMTCSHCGGFHNTTYKQVKEAYIDTGKVKFVFRPFPFDGAALRASMLASCSGPSRYEAFTSVIFAQQSQWAASQDPIGELKKIARLGGMSGAAFDQCMQNEALAKSIVATRKTGADDFGVRATPSFIIEGKLHSGALSFEQFEEALKPHLP